MSLNTKNNYSEILKTYLKEMCVDFTDGDILKILSFIEEIYNFNFKTNIVGTKDKEGIFYRHILDCLSIFSLKEEFNKQYLFNRKILDFGTGAGLPGILLAVLLKNTKIYLLEKHTRKADFLLKAITDFHLLNTTLLNYPAEKLAKNRKFTCFFDYCIARAVGKINILLELIIPFLKKNGKIFLYKSRKVFLEAEESSEILKKLGLEINRIEEIRVPYLDEFRAILILDKKN